MGKIVSRLLHEFASGNYEKSMINSDVISPVTQRGKYFTYTKFFLHFCKL